MKDRRTISLFGERPQTRLSLVDRSRWYQLEARASIAKELETHRSTLCVLATGLGKTEIFSYFAKDWKHGRVLVLAHRDELVSQAQKRLESITGEHVEIEQAALFSARARIVVGSVQSVCRDSRLDRLTRLGGFGLVIADEAHRYLAPTYKKVLDYFSSAKLLGVTATPDRSDARALGQLFNSVAYTMDLRDGIGAGYLTPIRGREVELTDVDLDAIDTSGGDLNGEQLDEAIVKSVEGVVKALLGHAGQRQGILFVPGVHSAHVAAARLNALKPGCAVSVCGETPKDERREMFQRYRDGRVQFLCNVAIATEGTDLPTASVIAMARPTKSRSLYAQCLGRGVRPLPGVVDQFTGKDEHAQRRSAIAASGKPNCLLIDFVGNNSRHTLCTPEDVLGGTYDDETRALAKKKRDENPEGDVGEALEEARDELEGKRLAAAAARIRSKVHSVSRDFDPFKFNGYDRAREDSFDGEYGYKPMSGKQRAMLLREGFAESALDGVSARAASKLIDGIIARGQQGLMSHKQAAVLARFGVTGQDVTAVAATAAINYIRGNSKVDPAIIRAMTSTEAL